MNASTDKIKVLVVDDSALIRQLLTEMLDSDPQIEVVGTARDPYDAREKIKQLNPHVLTLDVEMPRMDGVTFIRNLMRLRPMPVVMVSSLTEAGADVTLQALEYGAVDFVTKPKLDLAHGLREYADEIIGKVKLASRARVTALENNRSRITVTPRYSTDAVIKRQPRAVSFRSTEAVIAIGASTGGTEAVKNVLKDMPADSPGVVITQHIPPLFSATFAKRVNSVSPMQVCEAEDGQQILPGHAYVAPGDKHLLVERSGVRFYCRLNDGPPVNRHKPSVDVLFRSVAEHLGANAIGVILTGMGDDGARGLKEMHEAGATTLAQDEASSVVWGMPGEAVKIDAVDDVLPLEKMARRLCDWTRRHRHAGPNVA